MENTKKFYDINGFNLIRNVFSEKVKNIKEEIKDFLKYYGKKNNLINGNENYDDLVKKILKPGTKLRTFVYDSVYLINSIQELNRDSFIRDHLCKLGFKKPVSFDMGNVRFDINKPNEIKFLRGIHQDIRSIKTKKTVTIWIPLTNVNIENGTVVMYPGTQNDGIYSHIYDPNLLIPIDKLPRPLEILEKNKYIINASPGDVAIFNCFTLHRSEPAKIDTVRSVIQFTFTDIYVFDEKDDLFFLAAKYEPFSKKDEEIKKISTLK